MKLPLRIAVISDLHVGVSARARDLCPSDSNAPETGYRQKFLAFIATARLSADYLVLPGDVSNHATPEEVSLASDVVIEIAAALGVAMDRVFFVPGNHDVDWSVMSGKGDPTGLRMGQRYDPINGRDWVFSEIISRSAESLLEDPYFSVWEDEDVVAIGYNSSSHDGPTTSVHHGLISNESLSLLDSKLDSLDLSPARLRLFLVHHHPVQYSDPIPNEPDFSAMTNAGNLLRLLARRRFDLVIHGHKHSPRFETHIIDSAFPLAILCAGSFAAILDTRWSGFVNNQFHLIEVNGRDGANETIYGIVSSWTYLCGRGWLASQPNNGIPHISPFGTYMLPGELRTALEPIVGSLLETKSFVEWSEVLKGAPRLKHLKPERVVEVLDYLATRLSFRRHGTPPDEVILLKE